MITFDLPCKAYVKHFLEISFGSPAYLRYDSAIGKYFFQLVEDPREHQDTIAKCDYPETLRIQIRADLHLRKGCVLTKTNVRAFNTFVEDYFKTQIRNMLDSLVEFQGIQIKLAIDAVYDKFDMDETIFPQETIRKDYQRYRKAAESAPTRK